MVLGTVGAGGRAGERGAARPLHLEIGERPKSTRGWGVGVPGT